MVYSPPQVKNNPFLKTLWNEVYNKDLDAIIAVVGRRGFCKSGSAITLAYELDRTCENLPRFSLDRAFYTAQEFVELMERKLPKGSCMVWDEVGVENDSRSFMSMKNKLTKYTFETSRYKNRIVFLTAPVFNSIDISTRRLISGYISMKGKTWDGNWAKADWELIEVNPKDGFQFFKHMRVKNKKGILNKRKEIFIPRPPPFLEIPYKIKKDMVLSNWYKYYNSQLDFMKRKLKEFSDYDDGKDKKENPVQLVLSNPKKYIDKKTNKWSGILIEYELGLPSAKALSLAKYLNMKYVNILKEMKAISDIKQKFEDLKSGKEV